MAMAHRNKVIVVVNRGQRSGNLDKPYLVTASSLIFGCSLLALILLNWMFRALLPIVTFCVPRHPRIASWIAQRLISLTNPR
jgi:hypothetical protein